MERHMSTFDDPFDFSRRRNRSGCTCGRHRSQAEHDHEGRRMLQCASVESAPRDEDRYGGIVSSAVMRAVFPKDASRRAFLKSVGGATALAALSQVFPLDRASEAFAEAGTIEKK